MGIYKWGERGSFSQMHLNGEHKTGISPFSQYIGLQIKHPFLNFQKYTHLPVWTVGTRSR